MAISLSPYGKFVEKEKPTHTLLNVFIVMKSWYSPRHGPYAVQHTKVMRGYSYKPDADADVEKLNQECKFCPTRTAQKTRYWVDARQLNIRVRNHNG